MPSDPKPTGRAPRRGGLGADPLADIIGGTPAASPAPAPAPAPTPKEAATSLRAAFEQAIAEQGRQTSPAPSAAPAGGRIAAPRRAPAARPAVDQVPAPAVATAKERATFHVPADLLEHIRNAVVQLSGPPERLTLTDFVERAFRAELARLEREHNGGKPFPPRTGEVRTGRPIGR